MLPIEAAASAARRARQGTALLPWAPVLLGAVYLIVFAARFPRLIERVYWDSDAATAAVIAETADGGTVVLERFGWFTSLWFALLTRPLPFHRQVWEIAPYLFALGSVALLAWASWRLAGRWAAAMTATVAVATSPFVSYSRVTLNYHTATWVATVVLAVFALWIAQKPRTDRVLTAAVLVTALAGTTLASDRLFAFVGLIPFALTGLLLLFVLRTPLQGAVVVACAALALPIAWATSWAMTASNVKVLPVPTRFAEDTDLWPNFGRLLRVIVQLANGDYFFDAQLSVRSTLSFSCAVLVLLALAAPFVLVRRELRSAMPSQPLLVYASFWAACVALNCASFVLSSEGTHPGHYLTPVLYAVAATVPLALSTSAGRQLLAGLGIAVVATASLVNLADSKTHLAGGLPPLASIAEQVVDIAEKEAAPYGYADYWDATSLTWSTKMAVRVQPVVPCRLPESDVLCPYWFNVISSWYEPRSSKSFVLRDRSSLTMTSEPSETFGAPSATYEIDDVFTLYVYPYDVASRFDYSSANWPHGE
jgi:hypothetical protein